MNIILLISDTFRWDNLFDRGTPPVRTPNLDAFAERAVSVEHMYTGSFPTIPHRTDMTSGRVGWPWYPWQDRTDSTANHLPQILRQAGYVSQLLCDCPHLFNNGFQHGFDGKYVVRGQEGDIDRLHLNDPVAKAMPEGKTRLDIRWRGATLADMGQWVHRDWKYETDRFPPRTAAMACEWLEDNYKHDPLFFWLDFFDPHEPWDPPEYMIGKYDGKYDGKPMLHPNYGKASAYTRPELRNMRARYCAEAEMVDRWVGRVLSKIDDLGLWDNSIVVFTSDHGFSIGEHNSVGKCNINAGDDRNWPLWPEIAHVPFMIAAPGLPAGSRVNELAQPVDILPTLIDLAGLNSKVTPPDPIHGRSLAPLLRGRSNRPIRDFAVTASFLRADEKGRPPAKCIAPMVYTKKWAYTPIGPRGKPGLFDLTKDAYAEKDVIRAHPAVAKRLHGKLLQYLKDLDAPAEAIAVFQ